MKKQVSIRLLAISVVVISTGLISGLLWVSIIPKPHEQLFWSSVSSPEEEGLDSIKLGQVVQWIKKHNFGIDSLIIIRNGELVVEEYISLDETIDQVVSGRDTKHLIASCTKSITSALIGIAIDQGFIPSVHEKVLDFFPDYLDSIENLDSRKLAMTIEDLLTMRTGLDWWQPGSMDPMFNTPETDSYGMYNSPDYIAYTLSQPMIFDPGVAFAYCGGASHLLSAIIERTTGRSTLDFAKANLFGPLGITDVFWPRAAEGTYIGSGGVTMNSIDMAKFGTLFLNNGSWRGEQIISPEWITTSTLTHHYFDSYNGYGYQWWTYPELGVYAAFGANCQRIFVIPEYEMVVVFTANIPSPPNPEFGLLLHILNAVEDQEVFSKYGFTLNYTFGLNPNERTDFINPLSNSSGKVDFNSQNWPQLKYTIQWTERSNPPDLLSELNDYIRSFKLRNPSISYLAKGEVYTTVKDGHETVYQEFIMTEQGLDHWGVISCWYCEETARKIYLLYYNLDVDLIKNFLQFIEFSYCH